MVSAHCFKGSPEYIKTKVGTRVGYFSDLMLEEGRRQAAEYEERQLEWIRAFLGDEEADRHTEGWARAIKAYERYEMEALEARRQHEEEWEVLESAYNTQIEETDTNYLSARSSEEKGKDGELAFREWLDKNNFSYLYIDQSQEQFAQMFQGDIKRPDFLVLVESIGLIAVDVKNQALYQDRYWSLGLDSEVKKTIAFERLFRIPVWYAFNDDLVHDSDQWHWMSALQVVENGRQLFNKEKKLYFLGLDKKKFVEVRSKADFGRLYTSTLTTLKGLKEF